MVYQIDPKGNRRKFNLFDSKMKLKSLLILSSFVLLSHQANSQLREDRISFYNAPAKTESALDEVLYSDGSYKEYFISIHVSTMAATQNLHFEIVTADNKTIVIKKSYSKEFLFSNFKSGSDIIISLGNLEVIDYELRIRQEKVNKKQDIVITKTISQN